MALETLLVLLFTVFAVPVACFCVLLGAYIRGLYRGYQWRKSDMKYRRRYAR